MPIPGLNHNTETRDVRIRNYKEQWARFDAWMIRRGCTSLAEGVRAAIAQVIETANNHQTESEAQSARAG